MKACSKLFSSPVRLQTSCIQMFSVCPGDVGIPTSFFELDPIECVPKDSYERLNASHKMVRITSVHPQLLLKLYHAHWRDPLQYWGSEEGVLLLELSGGLPFVVGYVALGKIKET